MMMLWVKALHIFFVASWFAGLFYLPRIFVNLAMEENAAAHARLMVMSHKLFRFMTILAVPAILLGAWLFIGFGIGLHGPGNRWMHAKLLLVLVALGYHYGCGRLLKGFSNGCNRHSHRWYRYFNEIPALLLLLIVSLVVVKPF